MGCGISRPTAAANTQSARNNAKQAAAAKPAPAPKVKETKKEEDEEIELYGLGVPQIMVREPTAPRQQRPIKKEDNPLAPGKDPNAGPIKIDPRSNNFVVKSAPKEEVDPVTAVVTPTPAKEDAPIAKAPEVVTTTPEPEPEPISTNPIAAQNQDAVPINEQSSKPEEFEILNWHAVDISKDNSQYTEFAAAPPTNEKPTKDVGVEETPVITAKEPIKEAPAAPVVEDDHANDDMQILNWENVDISKNYSPAADKKVEEELPKIQSHGSFTSLKKKSDSKPDLFSPEKVDREEAQGPIYEPLKEEPKLSSIADLTKVSSKAELTKPADLTKVSSKAELAKASSIAEMTKASSKAELAKASSKADLAKASSKADLAKASSKADLKNESPTDEPQKETAPNTLESREISKVQLIEIPVEKGSPIEEIETPIQKPLYAELSPLEHDHETPIQEALQELTQPVAQEEETPISASEVAQNSIEEPTIPKEAPASASDEP